jgi:hypothetical protein
MRAGSATQPGGAAKASPNPTGNSATAQDGKERPPQPAAEGGTLEERAARLETRRVAPESEERKSPGGPGSQVASDVEPSGS